MKPGKETVFAMKHRAKQKAIRSHVKHRHTVVPAVAISAFMCAAFIGTIAITTNPDLLVPFVLIGTWIGLGLALIMMRAR